MELTKYRIEYSESGGIYIGKNIQSDFHKNHLLTIVLSFSEPFEIITKMNQSYSYEGAFIPKDTLYMLSTSQNDWTVFIHIDPYSEIGMKLNPKDSKIQPLKRYNFIKTLNIAKLLLQGVSNTRQSLDILLQSVVDPLTTTYSPRVLDERIQRCIQIISQSNSNALHLQDVAEQVFLSPSHLSHLFKQETGLTFKKFVLHRKLVKSLEAMHNQRNLTDASYIGGFSDQPHFTKAFKKSFGIKPSSSKH